MSNIGYFKRDEGDKNKADSKLCSAKPLQSYRYKAWFFLFNHKATEAINMVKLIMETSQHHAEVLKVMGQVSQIVDEN